MHLFLLLIVTLLVLWFGILHHRTIIIFLVSERIRVVLSILDNRKSLLLHLDLILLHHRSIIKITSSLVITLERWMYGERHDLMHQVICKDLIVYGMFKERVHLMSLSLFQYLNPHYHQLLLVINIISQYERMLPISQVLNNWWKWLKVMVDCL